MQRGAVGGRSSGRAFHVKGLKNSADLYLKAWRFANSPAGPPLSYGARGNKSNRKQEWSAEASRSYLSYWLSYPFIGKAVSEPTHICRTC